MPPIRSSRPPPTCFKCQMHGVPDVPVKGHKRHCPYMRCSCSSCMTSLERNEVDKKMRQAKQTVVDLVTPAIQAAYPSSCNVGIDYSMSSSNNNTPLALTTQALATPPINNTGLNTTAMNSPGLNAPGMNSTAMNVPGLNSTALNNPGLNAPATDFSNVHSLSRNDSISTDRDRPTAKSHSQSYLTNGEDLSMHSTRRLSPEPQAQQLMPLSLGSPVMSKDTTSLQEQSYTDLLNSAAEINTYNHTIKSTAQTVLPSPPHSISPHSISPLSTSPHSYPAIHNRGIVQINVAAPQQPLITSSKVDSLLTATINQELASRTMPLDLGSDYLGRPSPSVSSPVQGQFSGHVSKPYETNSPPLHDIFERHQLNVLTPVATPDKLSKYNTTGSTGTASDYISSSPSSSSTSSEYIGTLNVLAPSADFSSVYSLSSTDTMLQRVKTIDNALVSSFTNNLNGQDLRTTVLHRPTVEESSNLLSLDRPQNLSLDIKYRDVYQHSTHNHTHNHAEPVKYGHFLESC